MSHDLYEETGNVPRREDQEPVPGRQGRRTPTRRVRDRQARRRDLSRLRIPMSYEEPDAPPDPSTVAHSALVGSPLQVAHAPAASSPFLSAPAQRGVTDDIFQMPDHIDGIRPLPYRRASHSHSSQPHSPSRTDPFDPPRHVGEDVVVDVVVEAEEEEGEGVPDDDDGKVMRRISTSPDILRGLRKRTPKPAGVEAEAEVVVVAAKPKKKVLKRRPKKLKSPGTKAASHPKSLPGPTVVDLGPSGIDEDDDDEDERGRSRSRSDRRRLPRTIVPHIRGSASAATPSTTRNVIVSDDDKVKVKVKGKVKGKGKGRKRKVKRLKTIGDIRRKLLRYEDGRKRFLLIGLEQECAIYEDIAGLFKRVKHSLESRYRAAPSNHRPTIEPFWIDIQSPDEDDMNSIQQFFSLHKLTTEDCLCNDSGEKWELFPNYLFVCVRTVDKEIQNQFEELNVLVFRQFVITIHQGYFEEIEMVLKRIETEVESGISAAERKLLQMTDNVESKYDVDRVKEKMLRRQLGEAFSSSSSDFTEDEHDGEGPSTPATPEPSAAVVLPTPDTPATPEVDRRRKAIGRRDRDRGGGGGGSSKTSPSASDDLARLKQQAREGVTIPRRTRKPTGTGMATAPPKRSLRRVLHDSRRRARTRPRRSRRKKADTEKDSETKIRSPCWILYLFVDVMTDMYIPLTDQLLLEVENIDELVLELRGNSEKIDLLRRLGFVKKKINRMKKLLITKHSIVLVLMSSQIRFLSKDTAVYFRDVVDHINQCLAKLESAKEALNQSHSNYMIKVSIEIAKSSKQTDTVMNRITLFASILAPLALMSGIWGMNVPVPGQYTDTLWWFFGIVVAMVVISVLCLMLLSPQLIPDYYKRLKKILCCCCRRRRRAVHADMYIS